MPRLPPPQFRYQNEQIAVKTEDLAALYDNQRQLRAGYKKLLEWALHEVESNNFQVLFRRCCLSVANSLHIPLESQTWFLRVGIHLRVSW